MNGYRAVILIILLLPIPLLFGVGGLHLISMNKLHRTAKMLDILERETFYLNNKIEQLRLIVEPVILKTFSIRNFSQGIEVLYEGKVVWKGAPEDLNMAYNIRYFGSVLLTHKDDKIIVMTSDHAFEYELKGNWDKRIAPFIEYNLQKLEPLIKAFNDKKREKMNLQVEIFRTRYDPYLLVFLSMPLISIAVEFYLLRKFGRKVEDDYVEVLKSPYIMIPTVSAYSALIILSLLYHMGTLLPIHIFIALYALLSIPSLAAVLLYYFRMHTE